MLSLLFPAYESLVPHMVLTAEERIENGEDYAEKEKDKRENGGEAITAWES